MADPNAADLDAARSLLRKGSRAGVGAQLGSEHARVLLDELQRLEQSSDRLRRQNKRLRRRLAAATGEEPGQLDEAEDVT